MKKIPYWLRIGLVSILLIHSSAVLSFLMFSRAFGGSSHGFFTEVYFATIKPFYGQYIYIISLVTIFTISSLIGKIIEKKYRTQVNQLLYKYKISVYLPLITLATVYYSSKIFSWIGRTEEVWPYIGLDESLDSLYANLMYMTFMYGEFFFFILIRLSWLGLGYAGIVQIRKGYKKYGIINLILFATLFIGMVKFLL